MNNKIVTAAIAALIVGGAGGFYGGMKYDQSKTASARLQTGPGRFAGANGLQGVGGQFRLRGNNQGGGFAAGQILSKDDKSITVKMQDGGSKIVFYSASTQISKPAPAQAADLNGGDNVVVAGTANSDGSLTAQSIQIRQLPQTTSSGQ